MLKGPRRACICGMGTRSRARPFIPEERCAERPGEERPLAVPAKASKKSSLIEFSAEKLDDPNEGTTFGNFSVTCKCPHCVRSVDTLIDYETSWVTWLLAFLVWLCIGWLAFWVLPLLWPVFKDVVHRCPTCLNAIARKARISLPTFRSELMSLKVGSCAIVLARKYVLVLLGLVGVIFTVYCLRYALPHPEMVKGPSSQLTWADFLEDCGPSKALRSSPQTARLVTEKYRNRTITWQGEVGPIREGVDFGFMKTKSLLFIRMNPPRYALRDAPDVALLFGEDLFLEVAKLNPGDWVQFEATLQHHGERGDPTVLALWHVAVESRYGTGSALESA
uniref:LITAF domain-containing protein n=1 Tax=Noctiluca scintillans TaxID=2966 RepID=A0A7S1ACG2_NOCSC